MEPGRCGRGRGRGRDQVGLSMTGFDGGGSRGRPNSGIGMSSRRTARGVITGSVVVAVVVVAAIVVVVVVVVVIVAVVFVVIKGSESNRLSAGFATNDKTREHKHEDDERSKCCPKHASMPLP